MVMASRGICALGMLWKKYATIKFLIIFSCCQIAVCQNCTYMQVTSKNGPIDVNTLCKKLYSTNECKSFVESFKKSDLPDGFPQNGDSVEKPGSIELSSLDTPDGKGIINPGLSIKWESPVSSTGRSSCIGYLITWTYQNPETYKLDARCRIYELNNTNEARKMMLNYIVDISRVYPSVSYTVRVYSLPSDENKNDTRVFQFAQMNSGVSYVNNTDPAKWAPAVVYTPNKNGTIDVRFTLSPPQFNLTLFEVGLLKGNNSLNYFVKQNYDGSVRSEAVSEGRVVFNNLSSDNYSVQIWVRDEFRYEPDKCKCWKIVNDKKQCQSVCGSVKTAYFYLDVTDPPSITTSATTSSATTTIATSTSASTKVPSIPPITSANTKDITSSNESTTIPVQSDAKNSDALIGWGVGGGLVATLVIVTIFLYCKRKQVSEFIERKHILKRLNSWLCPHSTIKKPIKQDPQPPLDEEPKNVLSGNLDSPITLPSVKTVYIVSAEDHEHHSKVVRCLANFLNTHCRCNAIISSFTDSHKTGLTEYALKNIDKASHIIFINSKGAELLIKALLEKKIYRMRDQNEIGLFNLNLRHIFTIQQQEAVDKVVLVTFDDNLCQRYILTPTSYKLPDNLPELLEKIHGFSEKEKKTYSMYMPLYKEHIPKLPETEKLMSAISSAKTFEAKNPDWLTDFFGSPMPCYENQPSIVSTQSKESGYCRSVSSENVSNAGSPSSVNGRPEFPLSDVLMRNQVMSENRSIFTIDSDFNDFMHCMKQGSRYNDVASCAVTLDPGQPPYNDFHPPDTQSSFTESGFSTALQNINNRNNWNGDSALVENSCAITLEPDQFSHNDIHPTDTQSTFTTSGFSMAHQNINSLNKCNNGSAPIESRLNHSTQVCDADTRNFKPPDSLSDINIDGFSTVLRECNAANELLFIKDSYSPEYSGVHQDSDSVSI